MKLESLRDLYLAELSNLSSAEEQIFKALPKVIKHTESPRAAASSGESSRRDKRV